MKIIEINEVPYGSTGRIALGIKQTAEKFGIETTLAFGYSWHPMTEIKGSYYKIGGPFNKLFHMFCSIFWGGEGFLSLISTALLIGKLRKERYDIIHLHNIHGSFLNLHMLFSYIKKKNIPVVWTFHDCWPFTGGCTHFTLNNCDKWKNGCNKCEYKKHFEANPCMSALRYQCKKKWFTGISNLIIVTPSKWLCGLVKQSFLNEYPIKVINNGINTEVFDYKRSNNGKLCSYDKHTILGVAMGWTYSKGLDAFIELARIIDDDRYEIVLVGTSREIDKQLPENIVSIHRTENVQQLVDIYSSASVFFNPTREDTYPTVNLEAIACGTPVVTFDACGSPETVNAVSGRVVKNRDVISAYREIEKICLDEEKNREKIAREAHLFQRDECFKKYCELYLDIFKNKDRRETLGN